MRLILSSRNPRDSIYSTEAGQVLYKADKSGYNVTSLRKAQDDGRLALYAEVEFHSFRSTRFRFNNTDASVDEIFRKEGWFNPKRVFRAPDGREYYWQEDGGHLDMFRRDGSKQLVVKFREGKRSFGPFIMGRPASLEVDNSCVPILDEIIMTLVYCQKQQQDRRRSNMMNSSSVAAANASAASASASGGTSC